MVATTHILNCFYSNNEVSVHTLLDGNTNSIYHHLSGIILILDLLFYVCLIYNKSKIFGTYENFVHTTKWTNLDFFQVGQFFCIIK